MQALKTDVLPIQGLYDFIQSRPGIREFHSTILRFIVLIHSTFFRERHPSSGGGGGAISDLRWDGRNPDEEEDAYRRRCLLQASKLLNRNGVKRKR